MGPRIRPPNAGYLEPHWYPLVFLLPCFPFGFLLEACQIGEPRWYPLVFRPFAGQIGEPHWYPLVFHTSGLTNWASLDARVRLLANRASSLPSKKETKMGSTAQMETALPFGRGPHFKVSSLPNKAPKIDSQSDWGLLHCSRFGCRFGFDWWEMAIQKGALHCLQLPLNHHQSLLQCSGVGFDVNLRWFWGGF